jgi:DNA-binding phage protein
MPQVSHDELMRKYLSDPTDSAAYLKVCLEDGNPWLIADAKMMIANIYESRQSNLR